jgi:OmpA-OmpF porin, OOP family
LIKQILISGLLCLVAGSVSAADLTEATPSQCLASADSTILSLHRPALITAITQYRDDAKSAAADKNVIYSNKATFDWAVATTVQCNVALGYLQNGFLDQSSATKCDCFHGRLMSLQ